MSCFDEEPKFNDMMNNNIFNKQSAEDIVKNKRIEHINSLEKKPFRDTIIQKEEIISLVIDLNILTIKQLIEKY